MSNSYGGCGKLLAPPERASLVRRFADDKDGAVAMIFGLMVVPSVMAIGLAVDLGRVVTVKHQTQGFIDGAALAAGRKFQENKNFEEAKQAAETYVAAAGGNIRHTVGTAEAVVTSNLSIGELNVAVTQWVHTPFSRVSEMLFPNQSQQDDPSAPGVCQSSKWACKKVTSNSAVKVARGMLEEDQTLEVSLMLDITGSMNNRPSGESSGPSKFVYMKTAAKDFIDIVLPRLDVTGDTRIAVAPFAANVYPGADIFNQIVKPLQGSCTRNVPGCSQYNYTKTSATNTTYTINASEQCIVDRKGSAEFTDARPTAGANTLFPRHYGSCPLYSASDPTRNAIVPLANDPAMLKSRIDRLTTGGMTAGHLGTAWAWYLVSPEWAPVFPVASQPKPYDPKAKKIAVLLTDGAYNAQYCNGLVTTVNHSRSESQRKQACTATTSFAAAEKLCAKMRAKGITIYTIGFDIDTSSNSFLKTKCATTPSHHYDVKSGSAIQNAFSDIALKVTALRLAR